MHEIARHWRLREHRLRLTGTRRELEDGTVQFKLPGSSNWVEARPNGLHHDEDPFEGRIIYQAPPEESALPLEIHAEEEISA
ncbi:hypothetical protein HYT60_01860 [Candidatus Woesebacteria bacterium]|nr:hypothetical protein [Candidatus Woesebacteria bacterium]